MRGPEKFIVIAGAAIIVGTFALFGKKKAPKDSKFDAPVPFDPPGPEWSLTDEHFKYRGLFISVIKDHTTIVPPQIFYTWVVRGTDNINVDPLAIADIEFPEKSEALGDAMKWVNTLKDGA